MKLTTERLILREWGKKDIKDLIENINDKNISQWVTAIPYPYKLKDAKWWADNCNKNKRKKPRENYDFAIELRNEKKVVGGIGFLEVKDGKGEIGCWLGKKYWRKNIMSESVVALINFGFNKLKLRKIVWKSFVINKASNALAKKFGFKLEGVLREDCKSIATGKIHDGNIYGLLKKEWKNKKNEPPILS